MTKEKKPRKISKQSMLIATLEEGPKTFNEIYEATKLSRGSINNYLKYFLDKKLGRKVHMDALSGELKYFLDKPNV